MGKHLCPWWMAYTFDNPLRRIIHRPEEIFRPYLRRGMTAIDLGCGMGYFSIGMAGIVGETGKVIAVDVQQRMLDVLAKRAQKAGVASRITTFLCAPTDIGVKEKVDFALAFWMAHETPDVANFLAQVQANLKDSARFLLAEPKLHVTSREFRDTLALAQNLGYRITDFPQISLSHAAVLETPRREKADVI